MSELSGASMQNLCVCVCWGGVSVEDHLKHLAKGPARSGKCAV